MKGLKRFGSAGALGSTPGFSPALVVELELTTHLSGPPLCHQEDCGGTGSPVLTPLMPAVNAALGARTGDSASCRTTISQRVLSRGQPGRGSITRGAGGCVSSDASFPRAPLHPPLPSSHHPKLSSPLLLPDLCLGLGLEKGKALTSVRPLPSDLCESSGLSQSSVAGGSEDKPPSSGW